MSTPKFTICIPSYNRGQVALRQVLHTLPLIAADCDILVLDNFSSRSLEGYGEIESLSKSEHRVRYIRHAANLGFHGNVLSCLKHANSDYLQIISDEDYSNPGAISDAMATFDEFPEVGLIRGSIGAIKGMRPRNSLIYPDQFLASGNSALSEFSLNTNYLSGIIYNKKLLVTMGIIREFESHLIDNLATAPYAHMHLDILISASCAVITSSEVVCYEGEEDANALDGKSAAQASAYTFTGRLEQFIGFRDLFRVVCGPDGLNDLSLLIYLYLKLVEKYCLLFRADSFLYTARGLSLGSLQESLRHFCVAASDIDEFAPVRTTVHDLVQECFRGALRRLDSRHKIS